MVVDDAGVLKGIFTDSDLARLLEQRREADLDRPVVELMNPSPTVVVRGTLVKDAIAILSSRKFSQLPVLDQAGRPVGIMDITDLIALLPQAGAVGSRDTAEDRDVSQRDAA